MKSVVTGVLAGVVTAGAVTSGCGGSGSDAPRAEPTTTHLPTTTIDPWAVPATIDAAYAQRILDEHGRILTAAWRRARRLGKVDAEVERLVRSVESADQAGSEITGLRREAKARFASLVPDPAVDAGKIVELRGASPTCIQVLVRVDISRLVRSGPVDQTAIELRPARPGEADRRRNPTGWIEDLRFPPDQPPLIGSPCARS
ncbi:MAG: hypothetical protein HYX34_12155 [Actinobacteria bacterium]|nr:hypothetical protein [Actinomycetota bacterium]